MKIITALLVCLVLTACIHQRHEWTDADFGRLAQELGKQQRHDLHK